MLSQDELDAIRKRAEAAQGPCELVIRNDGSDFADFEHLSHATFIAHARTDVPALLDAIEELEGGQILNRKAIARKDDRITELEGINAGLRKWQDLTRPGLEDDIASLKSHAKYLHKIMAEMSEERDLAKSQTGERIAVADKTKEISRIRRENERLLKTVDVLADRTDDAMIPGNKDPS